MVAQSSFDWSPRFETGQSDVDEDHKELFRRMNALFAATKNGTAKRPLLSLLQFLEVYTRSHFTREEKYTGMHNDATCKLNQVQHLQFLCDLTEIQKRIESEGVTPANVVGMNLMIGQWFTNHILNTDRQCFVNHINKDGHRCPGCI